MSRLRIGISPCPNDTFAFHGLISGRIELPFETEFVIRDVEELNRLALASRLDITKVSFHLAGKVLSDYLILNSGAALGRGCGPLLLTRPGMDLASVAEPVVAIPGRNTTAALLLRLFFAHERPLSPREPVLEEMLFSEIPDAVASGQVDAGLIIHESRFTYQEKGLVAVEDLGRWWEEQTGSPIPLGCIVGKRALGTSVLKRFDKALKRSIEAALKEPGPSLSFARDYAQEISEDVMRQHIGLYVNEFTLDMGEQGRRAVEQLFQLAGQAGIISSHPGDGKGQPIFLEK